MSSEAAIRRGTGVIANPAFFMIFFIAGSMGLAGLITIGISDVWGWGLTAITAVLFGLAWVTGLGERLFVGFLSVVAAVSWLAVTWVAFGALAAQGQMIWGVVLVVFNIVGPPAVIMGEKVLPLLVALVGGLFGILSIIVFVMVMAGIGLEH